MAMFNLLFAEQLNRFGINNVPAVATAPVFKNVLLDKLFISQNLVVIHFGYVIIYHYRVSFRNILKGIITKA
jgi:hypothetical protein